MHNVIVAFECEMYVIKVKLELRWDNYWVLVYFKKSSNTRNGERNGF